MTDVNIQHIVCIVLPSRRFKGRGSIDMLFDRGAHVAQGRVEAGDCHVLLEHHDRGLGVVVDQFH